MDLADVYRICHLTSAQCIFFSTAHGTFSKIDHILGHKASLSKYKKIEIIPCILTDHNALKLELNNKNNNRKHANNWKLNNTFLNDQWVIDGTKEKIKGFLEVNKVEKAFTKKWNNIQCSWITRINIVKMSMLPKKDLQIQYNRYQNSSVFLHRTRKKNDSNNS
jgi:hypothetical protein